MEYTFGFMVEKSSKKKKEIIVKWVAVFFLFSYETSRDVMLRAKWLGIRGEKRIAILWMQFVA